MKTKITSLLVATLLTLNVSATVHTVCNTGGSQFSSLDAAIGAAVPGDTLMLKNTNFEYQIIDCSPGWDKQLVVIGIGFNPDISNPKKVQIGYYNVCNSSFYNNNFGLSSGGNGSKFYGIEFTPNLTNGTTIANYTFEDCSFQNVVNFENNALFSVSFKNCIFKGNNTDNLRFPAALQALNIAVSNCIFNGTINANNNSTSTISIDHCVFLSNTVSPLNAIQFTTVQNSIFMNFASLSPSVLNCTFNNNLARLVSTLPPIGNSGTGNIVSSDPLFVTYTLGNLYVSTDNYKLQTGSPAIGAGVGASDIGIHNSTSTFNEAGEPLFVPVIRDMTVNGVNVPNNGNVNVKVRSTKAR